MARAVDQLARRQFKVARTSDFDLDRPDAELRRLAATGDVLTLAKGFYALVPEARRSPETTWRPSIEAVGLGMAAALHDIDAVTLVGPSAARALGCYPRALGEANVATPTQHRSRSTLVGTVRFVARDITKLDTIRTDTDLGPGWTTSPEQTALDLSRNRPAWNITEQTRREMLQFLAQRIDWTMIDAIAAETRSVNTLRRLRFELAR
jgi:hypothetical protein